MVSQILYNSVLFLQQKNKLPKEFGSYLDNNKPIVAQTFAQNNIININAQIIIWYSLST